MGRRICHSFSKTKIYETWCAMKARCNNKNNIHYKDYGGRGIKVCEEWNEFINFYRDMGDKPSKKHSIERIDNDKGYSPENCKWATSKEQSYNKRNNRWIEFKGEKLILEDWARKTGITQSLLINRLKKWSVEKALTFKNPRRNIRVNNKLITFNNMTKHQAEWARILNMNVVTLWGRLKKGWPIEKALSVPSRKREKRKDIVYNGEKLSISEWGRKFGINANTIQSRLDREWSIEKSLTYPIEIHIRR